MTCKLIIEKRYRGFTFKFDTLVEAGEFISAFSRHVQPDEDEHDAKYPWKYTIIPVMDNDSDGVEDDIPVK